MITADITSAILAYIWYVFGPIGIVVCILFIAWIFFPDRVERAFLLIRKVLAYFSKRHERKYISKHIELNINSSRKTF